MSIRIAARRALRAAAVAWLCTAMLPLQAGTTTAFTFHAQGYPGSRDRQVKVYVPAGLTGPAPMVMALHGCEQTHDNVLREWGLTDAADRFGFVLVAPFITSYDGERATNCWGFWFDQHRHQGSGEPEDLHRIAREVEARFAIDPKRRYVTGLSAGGAMSVVMATTHNEYWAAAASASGLPYGEDAASVSFSGCPGSATFHAVPRVVGDMRRELNNGYAIPLLVMQNLKDCTVLQAAGRNLRDAQLKVFGDAAHDTADTAKADGGACTPAFGADFGCERVVYTANGAPGGRSVVETVFYRGPIATSDPTDKDRGHYWIAGEHGVEAPYTQRRGPSYPDIVWEFFSRQVHQAVPDDPPATHCASASASPTVHLQAGRAERGGFFLFSALSNGDHVPLGVFWDSWSRVTLFEGPTGRWFVTQPQGCS